jgi:glyoxylase-like metal-dependent hydrolase (beta-lactamase superfamily II)
MTMVKLKKIIVLMFCLFSLNVIADQSLVLTPVTKNVWAIVGPLTNRTPENLGNNATFGFVVTDAGIVVIDSGGSMQGARAIHQLIKTVSDKPIRYVINSGGQDHRWFGNDYFAKQGAKIISSVLADEDHKKRSHAQWTMLETLMGKKALKGTREKFSDITFADEYKFTLGGVKFEIYHHGQAHTPGDAFIWLPQSKVMFTGDIVFTERMLGIGEESDSKSWLATFDAMAAYKPKYLVPGHGSPTTLKQAIKDTRDYLSFLRATVAEFMQQGGGAYELSRINQTRFDYLKNHETLTGRNALKVYTELEWE